jgi:hypothetical protein
MQELLRHRRRDLPPQLGLVLLQQEAVAASPGELVAISAVLHDDADSPDANFSFPFIDVSGRRYRSR